MELDELIRESSPVVGGPPAIAELRAGARRRRARRVRAAGVAVVVAVVAVAVPLLIPGDTKNSTVSVQPHPVGRTLSTWSKVVQLPPDTDVATPTQTTMVESGGNVFVITYEESDVRPADNWVRVARLDLLSGALTDLAYDSVRSVGSLFESAVGWRGGPAIVVNTTSGWVIDQWVDGAWRTIDRPPLPENAASGPTLATIGPDLVVSVPLLGTVDGGSQGVVAERVWSTADGRTWTELPEPPGGNGYGFYSGGDALVRQGFSPVTTGGSMTSILDAEATEWTVVPPPAFESYGALRSAEFEGVVVSCGTDEVRYDCSRWSPGDAEQGVADPPPFSQGRWQEGRSDNLQVVAVPGRGVVMTAGSELALYEPGRDRWRRLPDPPGAGGAANVVVVDGDVYATAYELRPEVDAPPTPAVYRLEVGADDPEVDRAAEVGDGYRVRLPSNRWTAGLGADGSGLSVGTGERVSDGQGGECPALQVDFAEGAAPDAPSKFAPLQLPESTPPCTPTVFTTGGGGRLFTMRVYRSGPTTPDDAIELMAVIGSFRAAAE